MEKPYFCVGEILRPQGVRGEAKVRPFAANPEDFLHWDTLYREEKGTYHAVGARCSRVHDGFAYITLEDCRSPEDVEKHRGEKVYIDRAHAAKLAEGEVYIQDLIGCVAMDENGETLGKLKDVLQNGPVDIYVFSSPRGEWMAPALQKVFPVTDVENQVLHVDRERLMEVAVFED
ncbi:MAG: 16S rRNA processing protein RimM [Clostridia bacterium]|nr:16S rRNA processing protein RimM [Clostridia bacterium]